MNDDVITEQELQVDDFLNLYLTNIKYLILFVKYFNLNNLYLLFIYPLFIVVY